MPLETVALLAATLSAVAVVLLIWVLVRIAQVKPELPPILVGQIAAIGPQAERAEKTVREELGKIRNESDSAAQRLRTEVQASIATFGNGLTASVEAVRGGVDKRLEGFTALQGEAAQSLRIEVGKSVAAFGEGLKSDVGQLSQTLTERLSVMSESMAALTRANEEAQNRLRETVEARLETLRAGNEAKLEQMRATVEEKLQSTLERRIGESFALVNERLESVQRGLGEMQALATGVGDLKRVLTNVKDRGTWGEMQLGAILSSILAPDQFEANVAVGDKRVEFAVRLPGRDSDDPVYLPIDSKFPTEDYQRLTDAYERADKAAMDEAAKAIERRIRLEAKTISGHYVVPPRTTDFAILFLPTEGLYAEVIRRPGLIDDLQRQHRICVAGPTTLAAMLNALVMGFRTLAIEKRTSEVWKVLSEAKTEFEKYAAVWDTLERQLGTAQNTIKEVKTRTRAVTRKLKDVETSEGLQRALPDLRPFAGENDDTAP